MGEFWNAFHFLRPWLLLLLFIPLLFYGRYFRGARNQSSWEKVCDKNLLNFLLIKGSSAQRKILGHLALTGMIVAIIAAAGPSWIKTEIPSLAPENPTVMLLNLSSEMKLKDLTPSRLDRAKYKIKDLLALLPNAQKGLIVYTSEPFMITPLTDDGQLIDNLLPAVTEDIMPANGDRLDRAIELAVEKFRNASYQRGEIIVFAPDVGERFDLALDAAKKAKQMNFHVNIAATTAEPAEKLQMIAEAGGGYYWNLQNGDKTLQKLAAEISGNPGELEESANWHTVWLDYGYYLLAVPMLCCLYFFRKGILVLLLLAATPAEAGFFLNGNQEGLKHFETSDFQEASRQFTDPLWKGAAYYRLGDYDKAYEEYAKVSGETALYNQGNALAKSGKTDEAIKKYEEVLKKNPNHEDAKFNLEYLKQQQQNQQQSSGNDNRDQQDKNQQQQQQKQNQQQNQQNPEQQQNSAAQQENNDENNGQNQPPENQDGNNQTSGKPQAEPDNRDTSNPQEQNGSSQQPLLDSQPQEKQPERQHGGGAQTKEEKMPEYNEEMQAKAQQYREIPEDPGGLLKAMIYREYKLNRYDEKS